MRKLSIIILVLVSSALKAQTYTASEMYVRIFSPAPIIDIEAISNASKVKLNTNKKELQIEIPVNSFKFKKALMQTHFNEKYVESDKYPTATFQGKYLENMDLNTDGIYNLKLNGKFNIHGVNKAKAIPCTITVKNQRVIFQTDFDLLSADFKIVAPDVIYRKVGQEVNVDVSGVLVVGGI